MPEKMTKIMDKMNEKLFDDTLQFTFFPAHSEFQYTLGERRATVFRFIFFSLVQTLFVFV